MRIEGWECTLNPEGTVRTAKHAENGTAIWMGGRLIAHADVPPEVFAWLIRSQLRTTWDTACMIGLGCPPQANSREAYDLNPYNGEPPNKDNDPS